MLKYFFVLLLSLYAFQSRAEIINQAPETIATAELQNFDHNSTQVKTLIQQALKLAGKNLRYHYGAADPKLGGMDCSGTMYYLLNTVSGLKEMPRSSHLIYQWIIEKGHFHTVNSPIFNSIQFSSLQPGDLLFSNGTHEVKHDPNVTQEVDPIDKTTLPYYLY